jgi:hypothetical protein
MGFEHGFQFQALIAIFPTENSDEPNFEKISTALGAASRPAVEMRSDFQRAARPVLSSISCAKRSLALSIRKIYYLVQTPISKASPPALRALRPRLRAEKHLPTIAQTREIKFP